jgi:hypothetical protein
MASKAMNVQSFIEFAIILKQRVWFSYESNATALPEASKSVTAFLSLNFSPKANFGVRHFLFGKLVTQILHLFHNSKALKAAEGLTSTLPSSVQKVET